MKKAPYFTIDMQDGIGSVLLPHDNADVIEDRVEKNLEALLKKERRGRLSAPAINYFLVGELEGAEGDYSKEEIQKNLTKSVPLEFRSFGRNLYLVSEAFLKVLTSFGPARFLAQKCVLQHKATRRKWSPFWFVAFAGELDQDAAKAGFAKREPYVAGWGGSPLYISEPLKKKLAVLKMKGVAFAKAAVDTKPKSLAELIKELQG